VGIVAVESEEQTDLRISLFLGKFHVKNFPERAWIFDA
jgi:hypothetical protein